MSLVRLLHLGLRLVRHQKFALRGDVRLALNFELRVDLFVFLLLTAHFIFLSDFRVSEQGVLGAAHLDHVL